MTELADRTRFLATTGLIAFPATQVTSADANTLDDYEEGSWTPSLSVGGSIAYTTQVGTYTKIGRLVMARCLLVLSTVTTPSGACSLVGLPFAAASGTKGGLAVLADGLETTAATALMAQVNGSASTIQLYRFAAGVLANAGPDLKTGCTLQITAIYEV